MDDVVLSSSWVPVEAWASLAAGTAWLLIFLGRFKILAMAKAKQFLDLTRNYNGEDLHAQRHGDTTWRVPWSWSALAEANLKVL